MNQRFAMVCLALACICAGPAWAQDSSTKDQQETVEPAKLERQIELLERRINRLRDKQAKQVTQLQSQLETLRDQYEQTSGEPAKPADLTDHQIAVCGELGLDVDRIALLEAKPLYTFTESEVDVYLRYASRLIPDLRQRVVHLARKNIGQPYEIYLLGEMPFEHHDPQPIYSLAKSDCLVFTEHTYAMALTHDWPDFIAMLQRIRYADGHISVFSRNHYTEADWNPNNAWLVRDITEELAGDHVKRFEQKIDRSRFFRNRYQLETDIPVQEAQHAYVRFEDIGLVKPGLQDGDFVNIVRGVVKQGAEPGQMQDIFGGSAWVGHVGLIVRGDDGQVHLIHSAKPAVREESIDHYIAESTRELAERDAAGKSRLLGFKFLRLEENPLSNLRDIDGENAPKVTLPSGDQASF